MTLTPKPDQTALVSTGVVARVLGLDQNAIRGMIEMGSLPEPQWMSLGRRVERVYTQEWLLLAMDSLRARRLFGPTLRSPFVPLGYQQMAIRFSSSAWTLDEIIENLAATNRLWALCNAVVGIQQQDVRPLHVRRLSAGSPMDVLVTIQTIAHVVGGPAIAAGLLIWILKNPEKFVGAIPRAVAEWREQWARVTRAGTDRQRAKLERKEFEMQVANTLAAMKQIPRVTDLAENDPTPLALQSDDDIRPRRRFLEATPTQAEDEPQSRDVEDVPEGE